MCRLQKFYNFVLYFQNLIHSQKEFTIWEPNKTKEKKLLLRCDQLQGRITKSAPLLHAGQTAYSKGKSTIHRIQSLLLFNEEQNMKNPQATFCS
jgi:hypothetical protein